MGAREGVIAGLVALLALPAAAGARSVAADPFTLTTPQLAGGQFELLTLSTRPAMVTGGDVLMAVRGLGPADRLTVAARFRDVSAAFAPVRAGEMRGLATGLPVGRSVITATARGPAGLRVARLAVVNHPITGPVISGPQQRPFVCQTKESGLGPPLDADCSIPTSFQWAYRSERDGRFRALDDPFAPYPDDVGQTTTSAGRTVPFVVRIETATINRGIARIAVLDDPAARGRGQPFAAAEWNRRVTHAFGEDCGPGYRQGTNSAQSVLGVGNANPNEFAALYGLTQRLGAGDVVVNSTMTTFGVYCNPLVSAETAAMLKEHVAEAYGLPDREVGVGGSGGAVQQYGAANSFPGLLDAATPIASFPDLTAITMTVLDCGVLVHYWQASRAMWTEQQQKAVTGQRSAGICRDWADGYLPLFDAERGCDPVVPRGVRCDLPTAIRNVVGVDPKTGRAYRPYDNTGVQYGLGALNAGEIDFARFIDLNRHAGGFDGDGHWSASRDAAAAEGVERLYRVGMVTGRGAVARIPIIDLATYLDFAPGADIHDDLRPFQSRARLERWAGTTNTQQIWRGFSLPADAQPALTEWMDAIDRAGRRGDPATVAATRPAAAGDRCVVRPTAASGGVVPGGIELPEQQSASGKGLCQAVFTAFSDPRIVAGGPLSGDVVKCALKPVDPRDYRTRPTAAQLDALRAAFPDGVCDWSRAGVGELTHSLSWPSVGAGTLHPPRSLAWTVARSVRR